MSDLPGVAYVGARLMFEETGIADLIVFVPTRFGDDRGFFSETWSERVFSERGLAFHWVQDNHSLSRDAGVLRGLHYQAPPMSQAKLVRCTHGRIWDVAVDVRPGSATYGRWHGLELSAENWKQLLVPRGFLHGFLTLAPDSEVQYKVDAPYSAEHDGAVAWDDPDLAVEWPADEAPKLSDKDRAAPRFADWVNPFGEDIR